MLIKIAFLEYVSSTVDMFRHGTMLSASDPSQHGPKPLLRHKLYFFITLSKVTTR
jgi:hypothetical protein